ncbi:MAG: hypothetical protein EA378_02750 [Phycisphaerales bacterium]|nr:MAG: hypothetical protein EA378_02750 [Phycisphaerales bacterium]
MRVLLDGAELTVESASLRSALEAAAAAAAANGRVIVEVEADGSPVPADDLASPSSEPMQAGELQMTSADPRSLVAVTLHDAGDAVAQLREGQARAAEAVQSGKIEDALATLAQVLGVWQAAHDAVEKGAALLGIDLDAMRLTLPSGANETVGPRVQSLAAKLGELKRAVTDQDWTALSDTLAYDLDEESVAWAGMLHAMGDQIQGGPARDNPAAGG